MISQEKLDLADSILGGANPPSNTPDDKMALADSILGIKPTQPTPEQNIGESRNAYYDRLKSQGINTYKIEREREKSLKEQNKQTGGFGSVVTGIGKSALQGLNFLTAPITDLFSLSMFDKKSLSQKITESKFLQPSTDVEEATMTALVTEAPMLSTISINRTPKAISNELKTAQSTEKAVDDLSTTIIGGKTAGRGQVLDDAVVAKNQQTRDNISNIMDDITPEDAKRIVKGDSTQEFVNTLATNRNKINKIYENTILEADRRGVTINGNILANEIVNNLKKDSRFSLLVKDLKKGVDNGTVKYDPANNRFLTDSKYLSKKSDEYNELLDRINELKNGSILPSELKARIDIANKEFKNAYKSNNGRIGTLSHQLDKEIGDASRAILRREMDKATKGLFTPFANKRAAYEDIFDKVQPRLNKSVTEKLKGRSKTAFEKAAETVENIDLQDILEFKPIRAVKLGVKSVLNRSKVSSVDDAIARAFKKHHKKATGKNVITLDDVYLGNLAKMRKEAYMSEFLEELNKFQDVSLLPPADVIILPEFTDSTIKAMRKLKLTPNEILVNEQNYKAFINELYKLLMTVPEQKKEETK
jgi:hypothetical protein